MNRVIKNITTNFEDLGILHSASSRPAVVFFNQCIDILSDASRIEGKVGHSKIKNKRIIKSMRKDTILFTKQNKWSIQKRKLNGTTNGLKIDCIRIKEDLSVGNNVLWNRSSMPTMPFWFLQLIFSYLFCVF